MNGRTKALAAAVGAVASLAFASSASANNIVVNTATDEAFMNNSNCSLREAIGAAEADTAANGCTAGSGTDTITIPASVTGPINLIADAAHGGDASHGPLLIQSSLSIVGTGMNQLTINAPAASRIFQITSGAGQVDISGLTISGGNPSEADEAHGGAIFSNATSMNLTNVKVTNSVVTATGTTSGDTSASGGGVYQTGALVLDHSIISTNVASADNPLMSDGEAIAQGAGVLSGGPTMIRDSTIQGNTAQSLDEHGLATGNAARTFGGGLAAGGTLTVERSAINGNTSAPTSDEGVAFAFGGGIEHFGSPSDAATIELSTIAGNTTLPAGGTPTLILQNGGGVIDFGGTTTVRSSTVMGNGPSNLSLEDAGANLAVASASAFTLQNSIVANPRGTGSTNCDELVTSSGTNIESGHSCIPTVGLATDHHDTNPQLGLLQDNGGPTQTMLPDPTSVAIDHGNALNQNDTTHDQRGLARPVDSATQTNTVDGADIGAVEAQAPAMPTVTGTSPASPSTDDTPLVTGTAPDEGSAEGATAISLFGSLSCTVAPLPPDGFASDFPTGIEVEVADNATTTIHALAKNGYGIESPCSTTSATYRHDELGPVITIDPLADSTDHTPTLVFHSPDLSTPLTFECSVDSGTSAPCTSPFTTTSLADGGHTFAVVGTDSLGNEGNPTTLSFTITTPAAPGPTAPGPTGPGPTAPTPTTKKKKCKKAKKRQASAAKKKCKKKK